jgi:hypothetical protein
MYSSYVIVNLDLLHFEWHGLTLSRVFDPPLDVGITWSGQNEYSDPIPLLGASKSIGLLHK